MKPEWKDAPEWANFLAMDDDGEWYWFEKRPVRSTEDYVGRWVAKGRSLAAGKETCPRMPYFERPR